MNNRTRTIQEIPTNRDKTMLKVRLYYNEGGNNFFSHRTEARGLYLSVTPVQTETRNGYAVETMNAFSGTKTLVKALTKFSRKTLDTFEVPAALLQELIAHVCSKNGLSISHEEHPLTIGVKPHA